MSELTPSQVAIAAECDAIREMLLAKNRVYGDSALNPVRLFSDASPTEQLLVRIDDKLSRIKRGQSAGEDTVQDLIGYLVLLRVAQRRGASSETPEHPELSESPQSADDLKGGAR